MGGTWWVKLPGVGGTSVSGFATNGILTFLYMSSEVVVWREEPESFRRCRSTGVRSKEVRTPENTRSPPPLEGRTRRAESASGPPDPKQRSHSGQGHPKKFT